MIHHFTWFRAGNGTCPKRVVFPFVQVLPSGPPLFFIANLSPYLLIIRARFGKSWIYEKRSNMSTKIDHEDMAVVSSSF